MIKLIKQRLERYDLSSDALKDQAIREVVQEIMIYALAQSNFFDKALFHGGTSLRIVHNLPRFSEDLDFMLRETEADFPWQRYLNELEEILIGYGIECEVQPKGKMDDRVRKAMLKDNSVTKQLNLSFKNRDPGQKIRIKLEIDLYPPENNREAETNLDFPYTHLVRHQDLPSNFALKIHAMLCRPYTKGRDWYDFAWYVSQGVQPNLPHLRSALIQNGSWQEQDDLYIDRDWLSSNISNAIERIKWDVAVSEVSEFLKHDEWQSVAPWNNSFFNKLLHHFIEYLE